ncbi:MAG: HlyC/CorC family transporter [Devosia sp.]|nr:HlyC/CorC family transporter [Devosia sp.]
MTPLLGALLIVALIGVSVVVSLSEIAFAAAREVRIRALAEAGDSRALRFVALRDDAGNVITALQIVTNAVSILAGTLGHDAFGPVFADGLRLIGVSAELALPIGSVLAFLLVTMLFVLLADLTPKRIAMLVPEQVALALVWFACPR